MNNDQTIIKPRSTMGRFHFWILRKLRAKKTMSRIINRAYENGHLDSVQFHNLHALNDRVWM